MANKEVSEEFEVPKIAISTLMKNERLFSALQETSSFTKKIRSCNYKEVDTTVYDWFNLQKSQQTPIDGVLIKEKGTFSLKQTNIAEFFSKVGYFFWLKNTY